MTVEPEKLPKPASGFRTILPQIFASTGKNLLLLDLGLAVAFPTIIIPVLRGLQKERYPDETIYMSAEAASWYGSVSYIVKPIGSAMSGWLAEQIGRKRAMILVNVPHIVAWTMLYFAKSTEEVFLAAILLGLGIGFMEAPVVTYVGEICQPRIRGILVACSGVAVMLGVFLMYLLGTLMDWRNVALTCLFLPMIALTVICFLPETPLWLLSKGREAEALKSLQWLRGWVSAPAVAPEFAEMQRYSESSNSCIKCQKLAIKCTHPAPTFGDRLKELTRKRTLRPFAIVMFCFVTHQFGGMMSIRPYMVQVFQAFGVPLDANWTTVIIGVMSLTANIVCMCTISVVGKRKLLLFSITGTALSCFALSVYAYYTLPFDWSSFDPHTIQTVAVPENYFAMIMFFSLAFFTSVGAGPIPWMFLSESFPFKARGIATGLTAALNYGVTFLSVKTYLNMENTLSIFGVFCLFGVVNVIAFIGIYMIYPETEGFTLEEVELYFSDSHRKMTDLRINKILDNPSGEKGKKGCDNAVFSLN